MRWFCSRGCATLSLVSGWMGDVLVQFLLELRVIMIVILLNFCSLYT